MERRLRVSCGDPYIQEALEGQFADRSIAICSHAPFHLIVDRPLGWALLPHPEIDYPKAIILSDNLCPSYQLDLLERQPAALVSAVEDISTALLDQIRTGYSYYPQIKSPLTTSERGTLKLVALGYTNKEIAAHRGVKERTVKNTLAEIYRKLNLRSRVQATHYYMGHWHFIPQGSEPID